MKLHLILFLSPFDLGISRPQATTTRLHSRLKHLRPCSVQHLRPAPFPPSTQLLSVLTARCQQCIAEFQLLLFQIPLQTTASTTDPTPSGSESKMSIMMNPNRYL
ncbi:hypothetical protein L1887_03185 [Cichorium endivia]|nr:hypothetical protein L1887_03185 [Cichorium endivia]